MTAADPQVSIVVPLSGGPAQALRCFQGIACQPDDPSFEVIVVDDASVGLDPLLASLSGDVELIRTGRRRGFAACAQLGVERANGELVVLLRDAAEPAPGWLLPLVQALEDRSVGLAASTTVGCAATSPVAAWSVAVRAEHIRDRGIPDVASQLAFGALALSLAEHGEHVVAVEASKITAPGARIGAGRRPPGETPDVAIIIPTLDAAADRVRSCISAVQATTDVAHEIVIIDNGSPPQGFTDPVNAGLRAARTPYVVVMNDDVEPLPGWWPPLRSALDDGATVAFPLTVDGGMRRDFAAWCFAMTAHGVADFSHEPGEFFDPSFVVWFQDTDLLSRLRGAGQPPVLVESSRIRHGLSETVLSEDPVLRAWIIEQTAADREQFLRKHPNAPSELLPLARNAS